MRIATGTLDIDLGTPEHVVLAVPADATHINIQTTPVNYATTTAVVELMGSLSPRRFGVLPEGQALVELAGPAVARHRVDGLFSLGFILTTADAGKIARLGYTFTSERLPDGA